MVIGNQSVQSIAALDRSFSGMLVLAGGESKDFLQRISTNNVAALTPGRALQTVLTDEKGRVIDVVTAVCRDDASLLLLTGEGRARADEAWLEKFIIMEDLLIRDETAHHACAVVLGDGADAIAGESFVFRFSFFSNPAALVLAPTAPELSAFLSSRSIPVLSPQAYDDYRIRHGIPEMGREITEKTNPLEAGLRGLVDFSKGCYIGQEVIARLNTYEKVQRSLCRVRLSSRPDHENDVEIIGEDAVHGYITTIGHATREDGSVAALAMMRSRPAVPDARLTVRDTHIGVAVETVYA